jgi:signal transduction histidine kinase
MSSIAKPFFLSVWAVLLLAVIIGGGIASNFAASRLNEDDALVRHTYRVMTTLDHTLGSLQDAETGERGFLITGRTEYLEPYNTGVEHVENDLATLRALTADNPQQQQRLADLAPLVSARLAELGQTIALRSEAGFDAARIEARMNQGKLTMDAVRRRIAAFSQEEGALLQRRGSARDDASKALSLALFMSSVAAVVLFLLTIGQVSRRLKAEHLAWEEAQRAAQIKDEFIATVSHELRTPLTSILGWIQMLQARTLDPDTEREALAMIERGARAQTHLVDDLLEMARISSGKLRLDIRPFVLPDVVISAIESIRPAADGKRIRLTQAIDPDAGPVSGDPDRIQQIVWNLLSNAIKFTDKDGSVHVAVQRINSYVEIVVRDSGDGIDAEFLPYVFERFRQDDSRRKSANKGLGLGLAIVRQLAELQGGSVRAFSEGKGTGATFAVALPVARGSGEQKADERAVPESSTT